MAHRHAERARVELGLSVEDLWLAYIALGGDASLRQLDGYLIDGDGFAGKQYDYVAQALNDGYVAVGGDHPVPYADDLKGQF
jgi:hypothetical protein